VAAATADGYTLLIAGQSIVYSPMLYPNLGFDPLKSFVLVATLVEWSQLLVVAPSVPVKNVEELVAYAKANPGRLSLGYGTGTTPHIIGEMFKVVTKADINSVPYRGGAQAVTDLLGGRIHMNIGTTATLLPWIRQGKLRALAFSGMKRSSDLPEVPTLLESGFAQLAFEPTWQGVLAPAGTPTAVINKLNAAVRESFSSPQVEATLSKLGFDKKLTSPQEFAVFLAAEAQRWPPIISASGVMAE
jgi:tripartite-type tricarboxylate transporter receptor subunit TctC